MQQNNIQPFYVGQRVVCLRTRSNAYGHKCIKGTKYTIKAINQCTCGAWKVDIGITDPNVEWTHMLCDVCGSFYRRSADEIWANAKYFAPIIENFQSITLTKILETETPLVGVN